jgi:outer membrane protein OmpA-like peptidoglycan-associated protein
MTCPKLTRPWMGVAGTMVAALLSACSPPEKLGGGAQQDATTPTGAGGAAENAVTASSVWFSRKLYFGFDRVDLQPEHGQVVESLVAAAVQGDHVLRLEGFCESPCSAEQVEASAKRTHAVAAALERLGVRAACILTRTGRTDAALAADEDGRAEARSVRVLVSDIEGQCSDIRARAYSRT